jgi:glycerol-3-phosphate dehydrogenase (NAD(P)+)
MSETIQSFPSIAVIGSGSWASANVKILCESLPKVHWWIRTQEAVDHILKYKHNPKYLQSVQFDTNKLFISTDLNDIIQRVDYVLIITPSAFLTKMFADTPKELFDNKIVITAVKGIVPEYNAIPARFIHKSFGTPYDKIAMISGPCHAEEVALERLSYLTIACQNKEIAQAVAKMYACRYIKTSISDDLFGTELCAVLKNIYSIASGIYAGLGYGDNFQAVLVSNAIQEAERFIDAVNPVHRDVLTSAYLGDLLVTAYSRFSRNRTFGFMVGKGYSVKTAQLEMEMIAEGYYAVKSIVEINKKFQVDIPIVNAVYNVLYEKISPVIDMGILADKLS